MGIPLSSPGKTRFKFFPSSNTMDMVLFSKPDYFKFGTGVFTSPRGDENIDIKEIFENEKRN